MQLNPSKLLLNQPLFTELSQVFMNSYEYGLVVDLKKKKSTDENDLKVNKNIIAIKVHISELEAQVNILQAMSSEFSIGSLLS